MQAKLLETWCYHFLDQEQLGNHATHEDKACTVALVITCRSQGYQYHKHSFDEQLGCPHQKITKTHCLIIEGVTNLYFSNNLQHSRQLRWLISSVQQQGLETPQQCRNQVGSNKELKIASQKYVILLATFSLCLNTKWCTCTVRSHKK